MSEDRPAGEPPGGEHPPGGGPPGGEHPPGGGPPGGEHPPGGGPPVVIVELEAVRVATVRSIVEPDDLPAFMADALGMVVLALDQAGIRPAGPPFARYFSMSADGLDVAAGFPVAEPFFGAEVVHPGELPAGPAAVATHVGGFDGLEAAWRALRRRIDELGRRRGENPWEVYFVGPGSGVDEAAWRTELIWPLEPEGDRESMGAPPDAQTAAAPAPEQPTDEPPAADLTG